MEKYALSWSFSPDARDRQFPEVDPTVFRQSARQFKRLIEDADRILNQIAQSEQFARDVMDAAQRSDFDEVKHLIQQVGIVAELEVNFSPESLRLILRLDEGTTNCCILNLGIRWLAF